MSINLTLATPDFLICVTDRRLTRGAEIVTERSNKLTAFQCSDAHGLITYCGIGLDLQERTPSDWLSDLPDVGGWTLDELTAAIKADADPRLSHLGRIQGDVRHSFVVAGYKLGLPFIVVISNYESATTEEVRPVAGPELEVTGIMLNPSRPSTLPFALVSTGARANRSRLKAQILDRVKAGAPAGTLRKEMVKAVRDVAYGKGRLATVGSSVQSVVIGPASPFDTQMHVPGGTTLQEMPNLLTPGMRIRDVYIDVSGKPFRRFDPATGKPTIREAPCEACGAPVPEGYRQCGVCDGPV